MKWDSGLQLLAKGGGPACWFVGVAGRESVLCLRHKGRNCLWTQKSPALRAAGLPADMKQPQEEGLCGANYRSQAGIYRVIWGPGVKAMLPTQNSHSTGPGKLSTILDREARRWLWWLPGHQGQLPSQAPLLWGLCVRTCSKPTKIRLARSLFLIRISETTEGQGRKRKVLPRLHSVPSLKVPKYLIKTRLKESLSKPREYLDGNTNQ